MEPQEHPSAEATKNTPIEQRYAGFGRRLWATILDTFLWMLPIIVVLLYWTYGAEYFTVAPEDDSFIRGPADFFINYVFPLVVAVLFWIIKGATPGKMIVKTQVLDANTGEKITAGKAVLRYLGYFVSTVPLFLGFIWIFFDKKNQGFHDKIANTVVVYQPKKEQAAVSFPDAN